MVTTGGGAPRTNDAAAAAAVRPVVGIFDDVGSAERAVHALHAAGFGRDDVAMTIERIEAEGESPAPRSYATPYAFVCSLIGGAALGILAAIYAPHNLVIAGFGWRLSPVVLLSIVGGTFGWVLGAILGFAYLEPDRYEPEIVTLPQALFTVTVDAPTRPGEARTVLNAAGAREIRGGDTVHPKGPSPPTAGGPQGPRAGGTKSEAMRRPRPPAGQIRLSQSGTPAMPPGRHNRLPLGEQKQHQHVGATARPQRAGFALAIAVAVGALVAVLRRRRD